MLKMDIIKRNFFRLLRCGALNDMEPLEPMSLFKWEKLFRLMIYKNTEAVAAAAVNSYAQQQPEAMTKQTVNLFSKMSGARSGQSVVSLPEAQMSNFMLNRRLNNIREKELHAIDTSVETLNALNIILSNVYLLLNSGLSLNAILCLGKYMRTFGDKVDFVKLDSWLASLHMARMAQLEGSVLTMFFAFDKEELPFMRRESPDAAKVVARALSKRAASDAEDMRFWEAKTGFVAGDTTVLRRKIWAAVRYMSFAPVEASSNFLKNLSNSLAKIEE